MKLIVFLLFTLKAYPSIDLGEIVYSSKTKLNNFELSTQNFSLTDKEVSQRGGVINALKSIAGIDIIQNGGPGSSTAVSIRGSERRHTLVLINGIRMSDRSDIDGGFDFKLIPENIIEKIEVLTGSQTLLYGSDAMGGVVNIITKSYASQNSVQVSSGSTSSLTLNNSVLSDNYSLYVSGMHSEAQVVSSSSNGDELDGYNQQALYINLNYFYNQKLSSEFTLKSDNYDTELDEYNFLTGKTEDASLSQQTLSTLFSHKLSYKEGGKDIKLSASHNKTSRYEVSSTQELFEGQENIISVSYLNKTEQIDYLALLDYSEESFIQSGLDEVKNNEISIASSLIFKNGKSIIDIGTRYTKNRLASDNISSSVGLRTNYLRAQISQGFKTPSLYQLKGKAFGNLIGNNNLKPEKVNTASMGLDFNNFSLEGYYNKYYDLIGFDTKYINIDKFESHGISIVYTVSDKTQSFKSSIDLISYNSFKSRVTRKPNQLLKVTYSKNLKELLDLSLDYNYRGVSYEVINGDNKTLDAASVFNFSLSKGFLNQKLSLSILNAFDDKNQSAFGYSGSPRMYQFSYKLNY